MTVQMSYVEGRSRQNWAHSARILFFSIATQKLMTRSVAKYFQLIFFGASMYMVWVPGPLFPSYNGSKLDNSLKMGCVIKRQTDRQTLHHIIYIVIITVTSMAPGHIRLIFLFGIILAGSEHLCWVGLKEGRGRPRDVDWLKALVCTPCASNWQTGK